MADDEQDDEFLQEILNEKENTNLNTEDINIEEILQENINIHITDKETLNFLDEKGKELSELVNKQGISNMSNLNEFLSTRSPIEDNKPKTEEYVKIKSPIDFIQYMETEYIQNENKRISSQFYLKNYSFRKTKIGYNVLDFIPKTTLSSRFFKEGNIITSITAKDDVIFTGNNYGKIKMYSCEKEYEYKLLESEDISQNQKNNVICMDVSNGIDLLLAGYMNGYIALWDLDKSKCKKVINNQHTNMVLSCKFLHIGNNVYDIISSDLGGNVKKINISEGYFFTSVNGESLLQNEEDPIYLIEVLKLSDDEKEMFSNYNELPLIIGLVSLNIVRIYQIEPEPSLLFELRKPDYLTKSFIPDLAFGIGYPPRSTQSGLLPLTNETPVSLSAEHRLIAISWGKVIYIYKLPFSEEHGAEAPIYIGHYVNIVPILRIGFISNSILFIFDNNKHFKVLNVGLLTNGDVQFDKDNIPISLINKEFKPELENPQTIDNDILFQSYIPDKLDDENKGTKRTYNNHIISQTKTLFVLGKKNFHFAKLLNWEQCISNLQQNSEWMDALSLGLEIFHGRNISLADIPIDEEQRRTKIGYILKGLILQYTVNHTVSTQSTLTKEKYEELINKSIHICIEFCLDINDVNYLFDIIEPIFITKNCEHIFFEKLEPYILSGKINNKSLPSNTISNLIKLYLNKQDYYTLSRLFSQLSIDSINTDEIKSLCSEHNLLNPIIYIYMNNDEENYFYPLTKIYDKFSQAAPLDTKEFKGYEECLYQYKYNEIENPQ